MDFRGSIRIALGGIVSGTDIPREAKAKTTVLVTIAVSRVKKDTSESNNIARIGPEEDDGKQKVRESREKVIVLLKTSEALV